MSVKSRNDFQKPKKKGKKKLKTIWRIVLVIIIFASLPLSLIALKYTLDFRSNANLTENPEEIIISNITDTSVTISFETPNIKTKATVNFMKKGSTEDGVAVDERNAESNTTHLHYHILSGLEPETEYTYKLTIGAETYENPNYKFTTHSTPESAPTPLPVFGKVAGNNFEEGIVYIHLQDGGEDSYPVSALLPKSGAYTLDLGNAQFGDGRSQLGKELFVFINAGSQGKGQTTTKKTNDPIPEISVAESLEKYSPKPVIVTTVPTPKPTTASSPTLQPSIIPTGQPTPIVNEENIYKEIASLATEKYNLQNLINNVYAPRDIFLSNISEKSFTVNWTTPIATEGSIVYGINEQPNSRILDKRDTQTSIKKRYTHFVDVYLPTTTSTDTVNIRLLSDLFEFPENNQTISFQLPPLLDTPPSPTFKDGTITGIVNKTTDDVLIYAKADDNSTWTSTVILSGSNNWSLPLGNTRNYDLTQMNTFTTDTILNISTVAEYNATSTIIDTLSDTLTKMILNPGLSFTNITPNSIVPPGGAIEGTAIPNSSIIIKVKDRTYENIKSDQTGNWIFIIPEDLEVGQTNIEIQQNNNSILFNIEIKPLDDLPRTAITDWIVYLPAIIVLTTGIYLQIYTKNKRNW